MKHTKPIFCLCLLLSLLLALAACAVPNASPERAMEALSDAGYTVKEKHVAGLIHFGEGLTFAFEAKSEGSQDLLYVLYYESDEAAKKAWENAKTLGASYRPTDVGEEDWLVEKSGKIIFFGTRQAARDAG